MNIVCVEDPKEMWGTYFVTNVDDRQGLCDGLVATCTVQLAFYTAGSVDRERELPFVQVSVCCPVLPPICIGQDHGLEMRLSTGMPCSRTIVGDPCMYPIKISEVSKLVWLMGE
jgi:hypothetical protein